MTPNEKLKAFLTEQSVIRAKEQAVIDAARAFHEYNTVPGTHWAGQDAAISTAVRALDSDKRSLFQDIAQRDQELMRRLEDEMEV